MKIQFLILVSLLSINLTLKGQSPIDSVQFFLDEKPLDVTLIVDLNKLLNEKQKGNEMKATFKCNLPDSSVISEEIRINARGKFRRSYCYIPPLRLSFHNTTSPILYPLNSLKLVSGCKVGNNYEQLLLKEYLIYKMYNLITDKSFRVRLLNMTYQDSKGRKKPFTQYAFFVENVDAMAKRNHFKEWKNRILSYDDLERTQMTLVTVFEYMIGNTDWGITNSHNLRFIYSKKDSATKPHTVPYDFDYSGLVGAEYAIPNPDLGIETVQQRLYRGFPRTMDELETAFKVFNEQKENIYKLIMDFEPLTMRNRKDMISYLDGFYQTINRPRDVQYIFIENARKK
jgi:hypothetical protein